MQIDFFTEANKLWRKGLKNESLEQLDNFRNSFENDEEKELWIKEYLPTVKIPKDGWIKNEFFKKIFVDLINDVLIKGYLKQDEILMLYLYKYHINIEWQKWQVEYIGTIDLLSRLYKINPDNVEVEKLLLDERISGLKNSIINNPLIYQEWNPDYKRNWTEKDTRELLDELKILKRINRNKEHTEFLKDYENNLNRFIEK